MRSLAVITSPEEAYLVWIKHPFLLVPMQTAFACSVCFFVCICVFAWAVAFLTSPRYCVFFSKDSAIASSRKPSLVPLPPPTPPPNTHTHPDPSFPAVPLLPSARNSKMLSLWVCSYLQTLSSCRVWTVSGCEPVYSTASQSLLLEHSWRELTRAADHLRSGDRAASKTAKGGSSSSPRSVTISGHSGTFISPVKLPVYRRRLLAFFLFILAFFLRELHNLLSSTPCCTSSSEAHE